MLKSMAAVALAGVIWVAAGQAQQPSTPTVKVTDGMLLRLATMQTLDPNTAKPGDDVPLLLTRPFYVEGVTLLPAGEILHGTVTHATRVGAKCKYGQIKWKVEQIKFHDGTVVKTRIAFKTASPTQSVPTETVKLPISAADRAGEVIQAAVVSPVIATILIENAIKAPFRHNACSQYTKDVPLPVNATIALQITENRAVQY
jgi:hypothetical protein